MDLDEKQNSDCETVLNYYDINSAGFWIIIDDDDDFIIVKHKEHGKQTGPGYGNAVAGFREPYYLYLPSDVFKRV